MKVFKLGLLSVFVAGSLFAGTYNIDASHSHVGFKIKHMMISNVKGQFDTFTGNIEYDENSNSVKAIKGQVETASINTSDEKRDEHLRAQDLLDVQKYPEISYTLNKVEGDKAYGTLSMKGVSKEIVMELENNGVIKDPWGNQRVGLALNGKINRKDFGITWNKVLEAGGVAVGEEVKLEIELEGVLAK
ncbi:YceI family protein [Candidatus Marinarcus aquaticus]|uniref:Lipid/polyisoprenoid-binding YceI-like domain-containing protein n=1 Tax=Candidatus Marinarcus aquaticus TaxID=2044504 RepID=A0A4Q0XUI9_9BACT|nr:YceI family protein [Candidatus Marinarcus aquaticus]RXJ58111.1 hypothetical protein CRV04_06285 [Candidatus Marinarcus aquaticus]